jgi:uncharacterized CHY-type Zn-finger protein
VLQLHDIQEEKKEHCVGYHSEKLVVARTIRVIKNLRICFDCHNYMKHVLAILRDIIIIRDQN